MFEVKVIKNFTDMSENRERVIGETFELSNPYRARELLGDNPKHTQYVSLVSAKKRSSDKYEGKSIIIYQQYLYKIGGIETFLYNLTKQYKERNIAIVVNVIDAFKAMEIAEHADVIIDKPENTYECDVLILGNYNCTPALDKTTFKVAYQMIHADWMALKAYPVWRNYKWIPDKRVSKIITVSETARIGLKKAFKLESEVIYNILDNEPNDDVLRLITLSRASQEKGIGRIIKMAQEFKKQNKKFIWFLCTPFEQIDGKCGPLLHSIPEIILIPSSPNNKALIECCDYLVQLSDTESFCYSAFEALQRKVPVILTDFIEARNIVVDGENGYLLDMELNNLDINKIFNKIPTNVTFTDKCDLNKWEMVFKGEL